MAEPPLDEFVSLGYRITRYVEPPGYCEDWWAERAHEEFISLSTCLTEFIPDFDTFDDARPGNPVLEWYRAVIEPAFCYPDVFGALECARDFAARFLPADRCRLLLGLGVHADDYPRLIDALPTVEPPIGEPGFAIVANENGRLAPGGTDLGYDVLAYDWHLGCSWYCGEHDVDVREKFGIVANEYGLIDTYAQSRQCADYIDAPETSSEPGLWLPIRVVRYSER